MTLFDAVQQALANRITVRRIVIGAARETLGVVRRNPSGDPCDVTVEAVAPLPPKPRASTPPEPEPERCCPFCRQTPTVCAEWETSRTENWRALHANDLCEIERRAREATDEMYESLRRQREGWR